MRMIDQLVLFIAHVSGLNRKGEHEKALVAAEQAWSKLLDAPLEMIYSVDSKTLASMLGAPGRIRAAAQLLYEQGRALSATGDPLRAALRYRKAMELVLEARAIEPDEQDDAAIFELSRLVPSVSLERA